MDLSAEYSVFSQHLPHNQPDKLYSLTKFNQTLMQLQNDF